MGSPLSSILAEVYLNYFENSFLFANPTYNYNVVFYGRYVDDTFMVYKGTNRQIDKLHNYLNGINNKIQFTLENEVGGRLHFLDLTVTKDFVTKKLCFNIFRKPTMTDAVIHASSFHPISQKLAAFHSMIHRLLSIPLSIKDYIEELNTIKVIAFNNGYNERIIDNILKKQKKKKSTIKNEANDINNRNENLETKAHKLSLIHI